MHGMMVGTVSYMPPEQALGGEVTPQSDLYSLGAMLYEMVTGHPPFVGSDPTAIISQHINIPPVAPSWQTEHCPPALEQVILQMLEKDPAKRPSSAVEVLTALDHVDPAQKSASHSDSNVLESLARGVFVGREKELERLRKAFDNAFAGHGSVVMLVGEPGIGKTRTTQELETYARMRGAQVYWGRANEQGGAPPFWPWLLAGRAYRAQNSDEVLRREWEPYAVELQRIFPGLRTLFPALPEPPPADSEEGQFQLFDAMSGFFRGVSERVPLVVVLDDLHWADRATLQLLTHFARDLSRSRILVLGTYRDTDLDRRHPLSQALADMNREDLFLRLPLRGLAEPDVRDYIARAGGIEPSRELVRRVFEETEGNPFFLSEVVNLMAQEGTLTATSISDIAIPEGVRQALGRRLDRLSEETNALLTTLAVAGREFDHALVRALGGHDEQLTLRLVEEALRARVLEEMGAGAYRFTHALMQETLLGELSAARQVLLHGQIAEAFEALYGADDRNHLAALANHYAESAVLNRDHARAAARYLRLAAEQSAAVLGYDDAVRLYERCLAIIDQAHDPLDEDETALWAALALCHRYIGNFARGRVALDRALALHAARGDVHAQARVFTRFLEGAGPSIFRLERGLFDQLIAALGDADSLELCDLLAFRSRLDLGADGDLVAERTGEMASRLGLTGDAYPWSLKVRPAAARTERGEFREAAALWDAVVVPPGGVPASTRTNLRSMNLAWAGDIDAQAASRVEDIAQSRQYRRRGTEAGAVSELARIAWRRGERARYEELMAEIVVAVFPPPSLLAAAVALQEGDVAAALALLPGEDHPAMFPGLVIRTAALRTAILLVQGDRKGAALELERLQAAWDGGLAHERLQLLGDGGEAIVELADEAFARDVAAYLAALPLLRSLPFGHVNPDALRGWLALRFGQLDEAEQHFNTGLEWASRPDVRFGVDAGRCLQGLAEVAERRGDHALAMQHLDRAGALFSQHGAKLYLDQVLAKKEILKA
jgi:tetratricopeptide (TPR) repeat protein